MPGRAHCGGQVALAACATWPRRAARSGALRRQPRAPPTPSASAPPRPPGGHADRARAHGDAPELGGARVALGASLVDRAALARVARAAAGRALRLQRRRTPSRPASRQRGARLVPVLADPEHLAGELLANGPAAAQAGRSPERRAACARRARRRARLARPAADGARAVRRSSCTSCASSSASRRRSSSRCRPCARCSRSSTGAYDLRALARPARLLVLAWNEHGPRSEPGPVASLAFWKQHAAHRAAGRAALARADGRADLGLALERGAPGPSRRRRPSSSRRRRSWRSRGPTARASGERAWVESDRSVQLKLLTARQAGIAGVALWVRGGESSATWRQPLLAPGPARRQRPRGSTARS